MIAIVSKVPFTATDIHHRCGKEDCRHIEVGPRWPAAIDPARQSLHSGMRRRSDPDLNVKFAHKLDFYREMAQWFADRQARPGHRQGPAPRCRGRPQCGAARA